RSAGVPRVPPADGRPLRHLAGAARSRAHPVRQLPELRPVVGALLAGRARLDAPRGLVLAGPPPPRTAVPRLRPAPRSPGDRSRRRVGGGGGGEVRRGPCRGGGGGGARGAGR